MAFLSVGEGLGFHSQGCKIAAEPASSSPCWGDRFGIRGTGGERVAALPSV